MNIAEHIHLVLATMIEVKFLVSTAKRESASFDTVSKA